MTTVVNIVHRRKEVAEALQLCLNYATYENVNVFERVGALTNVKECMNLIDTEQIIDFINLQEGDAQYTLLVTSDNDPHIIEALYAGATSFINIARGPVELVKHMDAISGNQSDVSSEILRHFIAGKNVASNKHERDTYNLTRKEVGILIMMREGKHLKLIAQTTDTSYETVRTHVKRIYKKLGVVSASEAVIKAMTMDLR